MSSAAELPPERAEPTDGLPHVVVITGIGLAVGLALCLLAASWIYVACYNLPSARAAGPESSFQHAPHARTSIEHDWQAQDAAVRAHLDTYDWVDRDAGIVRIPINRAIDVLATDASASPPKDHR